MILFLFWHHLSHLPHRPFFALFITLLRYVCNLDGKVRKDELRHALYCLFSQVMASAAALLNVLGL
jgi:hypothetical protein